MNENIQIERRGVWPKIAGFFRANPEIAVINALLLAKVAAFGAFSGLHANYPVLLISTLGTLALLSSWFLLFPERWRGLLFAAFDALITLVLIADSLFYKYYHSIIPIPAVREIGQVGGVSSSVTALFSWQDAALLADFPFIAIFLWLRFKSQKEAKGSAFKTKFAHTTAAAAASFALMGASFFYVGASQGKEAFSNLYGSDAVIRHMGVLNFHLIDLYQYSHESAAAGSLPETELRTWMDIHRQQDAKLQGAAKGKNLIVIQMEALQGFLLGSSVGGKEVTPTLNKLAKSSMYFDNYFSQIGIGSTSDAELISLNSLYSILEGSAYLLKDKNAKNQYQSLPKMMKESGYGTYAFHGNTGQYYDRSSMYAAEGFDKFYEEKSFVIDDRIGIGISDESFLRQTAPILKQINSAGKPFFSFVITLSGHHPYEIPDGKKELSVPAGYSKTLENYLQAQHYADKQLGAFLAQLQKDGTLDNTVIAVYGDHFGPGLGLEDFQKFLNLDHEMTLYESSEIRKVPLLIHFPGDAHAQVVHASGGQMDFYPTVANLFGLDRSKMFYFGQDILNEKSGFSAFRFFDPDGSFATSDLLYIANKDGVFEHGHAFNRKNGQEVDVHGAKADYNRAKWHLNMSDSIYRNNGIPMLIPSP